LCKSRKLNKDGKPRSNQLFLFFQILTTFHSPRTMNTPGGIWQILQPANGNVDSTFHALAKRLTLGTAESAFLTNNFDCVYYSIDKQ